MRRAILRSVLRVCVLAVAGYLLPASVQAQSVNKSVNRAAVHWTSCAVHLDWQTATRITHRRCAEYTIKHRPAGTFAGYRTTTHQVSPHVRVIVRYPIFRTPQPRGYWATYWITGYSVCDSPGRYMADGTSVESLAGIYGAAATYPGYPGGLAFGTRVRIPSLNRVVTIHDRGSYAYFTVPHIDVYAHGDCQIFGNLAGLGSHYERVFIYAGVGSR